MTLADVEEALDGASGVVRLPALVDGNLVLAPTPAEVPAAQGRFRFDGGFGLRRPLLDTAGAPTAAVQTVVTPAIPAARLGRRDPALAAELARLPFAEVLAYIGALRETFSSCAPRLGGAARAAAAGSPAGNRRKQATVEMLEGMLDPEGVAAAVDRDLGAPAVPGRAFLDGWVPTGADAHSGLARRVAQEMLGVPAGPPPAPALRAVPTRQLHIAAGNADVIALVSVMRALATKGQAVVKSASEAFLAATLLAVAMHELDPEHPLTRAVSLVSWVGGDRGIEDALLHGGGFDRLVAWGSAETVASLRSRAPGGLRTIFLGPRSGVSLIGREVLANGGTAAAGLATADSLIEDQAACSSSLVHYVEGDEDQALGYCEAVRDALARWDALLPHTPSQVTAGRLRRLRRGELAGARWWLNRRGPVTTSAVAYARAPFDLSAHKPLALGFYWSPLKIFEYMAAGLPIVAPAADRIPKLVEGGVEGLLYQPASPVTGLADALERLTDVKLRTRLGAAARERAVRDYSWRAHCEALERAISGIQTTETQRHRDIQ